MNYRLLALRKTIELYSASVHPCFYYDI